MMPGFLHFGSPNRLPPPPVGERKRAPQIACVAARPAALGVRPTGDMNETTKTLDRQAAQSRNRSGVSRLDTLTTKRHRPRCISLQRPGPPPLTTIRAYVARRRISPRCVHFRQSALRSAKLNRSVRRRSPHLERSCRAEF
jgi:hypothetical protein